MPEHAAARAPHARARGLWKEHMFERRKNGSGSSLRRKGKQKQMVSFTDFAAGFLRAKRGIFGQKV